jgi:hypothetical protein
MISCPTNLSQRAAVFVDRGSQTLQAGVDQSPCVFQGKMLGEGREARKTGEQDRHQTALAGHGVDGSGDAISGDSLAALAAEGEQVRVLEPTTRALHPAAPFRCELDRQVLVSIGFNRVTRASEAMSAM